MQWHEAKRSMKRDQRWEVTKQLDHEEREQLFQDHVLELANKKRMHFRKLLEETAQVRIYKSTPPFTHPLPSLPLLILLSRSRWTCPGRKPGS